MKNKIIFITSIFFLVILASAFTSAVCCEKLKSGLWCQDATSASECNLTNGLVKWDYKICDQVPECNMTCINSKTGECSEGNPRDKCKEEGGTPSYNSEDGISQCKDICCLIGTDAWFLNPTQCKAKFELFNMQGTMRPDITTRLECEALKTTISTGACVISTATEKACKILTSTECTKAKIDELSQYLKNPAARDQIDVTFYDGLLCTAKYVNGNPISDCIPTNNTVCKDYKVYYTDGCGNIANVYNANMWNNKTYWTYMKKEYDASLCTVSADGNSTCGNCRTDQNTVCESWQDADVAQPSRISNPNGLVCGDMGCKVDLNGDGTKETKKQHGDSWCGDIKGAVNSGVLVINWNLTTGVISPSDRNALQNASKYNIPGSRYYKLRCEYGEVFVDECKDYRNQVCIQGVDDDTKRTVASCVANPWRICLSTTNRSACEDNTSLCKWIPGYTWVPGQVLPEAQREEYQGSCVPLIAPGFDFWKATGQGNAICSIAIAQENVLFEQHWTQPRSKLETGQSQSQSTDSWPLDLLAEKCLNGCYALPNYAWQFNQIVYQNGSVEAKSYPQDIVAAGGPRTKYQMLTLFYEGVFPLPNKVASYTLSLRKGQYCFKGGDPNRWSTGKVRNSVNLYDCTAVSLGKKGHVRDAPIYLTNDEWTRGLTERARAIGDCGYKTNINGKYSAPESEIITAIFQRLKQNGNVKKNVTVEQIIWKGGAYVKGNLEPYETDAPTAETQSNSCGDYGGVCLTTSFDPNPCKPEEEGTVKSEGTCGANAVCCVYPVLGDDEELG